MYNTPVKTPRNKANTPHGNSSRYSKCDPVEVYCRIKPIVSNDEKYLKIINNTTLQLNPPSKYQSISNSIKEVKFNAILDENADQRSVFTSVAKPLIEDLISGKNGLIFAYGVTGSGKTHTICGTNTNSGLLPRSLDVLFNTIQNNQAKQGVFKMDKGLIVDLQSPYSMESHDFKIKDKDIEQEINFRLTDPTEVKKNDETTVYGVFISYIEIYNNYVYDLLEEIQYDSVGNPKPPISKQLREDSNKNIYVQSVIEKQVISSNEAYSCFLIGQKRRRIAFTQLNAESSRSHSAFIIRLVQAPSDNVRNEPIMDPSLCHVSCLSICDLAGSERTGRTMNYGDRLKEASNINNSLLSLRSCIECLRENQKLVESGLAPRVVPYRDNKLTFLFRNFFEGRGKIKVIVCMNPSIDDYEESLQVARFAEVTQVIKVAKCDTPLVKPLRSFKRDLTAVQQNELESMNCDDSVLNYPSLQVPNFNGFNDDNYFTNIIGILNQCSRVKDELTKSICWKIDRVSKYISDNQDDNNTNSYKKRIIDLEACLAEKEIVVSNCRKEYNELNIALNEKIQHLNNEKEHMKEEVELLKKRLDSASENIRNNCEKELSRKIELKEAEMNNKLYDKVKKLKKIQNLVNEFECNDKRMNENKENCQMHVNSPSYVKRLPKPDINPALKLKIRRSKSLSGRNNQD